MKGYHKVTRSEEKQHEMLELESVATVHEVSPGRLDESSIDHSTDHISRIKARPSHGLVYSIEDRPPWQTTVLLGLQHFLTDIGSNVSTVFILAPYLCISHDLLTKGKLIATLFVVNGIVTLLQSTFGVRLPILQGTTFAFMIPTLSILNLRGECPTAPTENSTSEEIIETEEEWLSRIREIQGAIMVASLFQVLVGATGIVGFMMNFIGPLTVTPTITLIGLSLSKSAALKSGQHWGIAIMTMVLIIAFSQYLPEVNVPIPSYNSSKKCHVTRVKIFKIFPIIFGIAVAWLLSCLFTATAVFPDDPAVYGYHARTDLNNDVLQKAPWLPLPYPGQWGTPTVSISSALGIVAGVIASIIESIGDYYACARMSGAPPPPQHAVNRGVLVEGIGCLLAGAFGSGNGTTSHSANIGVIGLTRVGSRVIIQVAGCLMIVTGLLIKLSALSATIPEPIIGGVLCITFGFVTAVGLSNLQFIDLNSSRNLFIIGFSTLMGLIVPYYFENNRDIIKTGSDELDQILMVLLTMGMFIAGSLGMVLDNTIAGTDEERGLLAWRKHVISDKDETSYQDVQQEQTNGDCKEKNSTRISEGVADTTNTDTSTLRCYDLPFGMKYIRRWTWCRYLPFSPTFRGYHCRCLGICSCRRNR